MQQCTIGMARPAELQHADPSGVIFGIVLGYVGYVGYVGYDPIISLVLALNLTLVPARDTSPEPLHAATTH